MSEVNAWPQPPREQCQCRSLCEGKKKRMRLIHESRFGWRERRGCEGCAVCLARLMVGVRVLCPGEDGRNSPDMSATSTWTAARRCVIISRMLASVICDMLAVYIRLSDAVVVKQADDEID